MDFNKATNLVLFREGQGANQKAIACGLLLRVNGPSLVVQAIDKR
jgi:hypothetical protein